MTTEYLPEQTIRYRTFIKNTLVDALNKVFADHPDTLLQHTKASIEFSRIEVDYPRVIINFYERELVNAGVGHEEILHFSGESDSIEAVAAINSLGSVQLTWPAVANAVGYTVYRTNVTKPGLLFGLPSVPSSTTNPDTTLLPGTPENFPILVGDFSRDTQAWFVTTPSFTDEGGSQGESRALPTLVTANLAVPQPTVVVGPPGALQGTWYYRVTAVAPSDAVKFDHYFYTGDVEFAVYGLSSLDRDLIADTLVQMIAMGRLEDYTNRFYDQVYPDQELYPDSFWHFISVNSDRIQGFGETETQVPWGAEDDLLYQTSYRVGVFGELYSLPPKITWALVRQIFQYPYVAGVDPVPTGNPNDDAEWHSNAVPF